MIRLNQHWGGGGANLSASGAMSAKPERLFSGAKITITDRRNRIGIEAIEALECLKSWLGLKATAWGKHPWIRWD